MANERTRLEEEIDEVRRLRDELRVRMHLAKSEVQTLWDSLEHKVENLEARASQIAREAEEPLEEVGAAARLLLDEIRDGYRRIRSSL